MKVYVNVYTEWGDDDKYEDEYMGAWTTLKLAEAQIKPIDDKIKAAAKLKYNISYQERRDLKYDDPRHEEYNRIQREKSKWDGIQVYTIELEIDKPTENWK